MNSTVKSFRMRGYPMKLLVRWLLQHTVKGERRFEEERKEATDQKVRETQTIQNSQNHPTETTLHSQNSSTEQHTESEHTAEGNREVTPQAHTNELWKSDTLQPEDSKCERGYKAQRFATCRYG
jgi:hypothetical protein